MLAQAFIALAAKREMEGLARMGPGADPQLVDAYQAELERLGRMIDGTVFGENGQRDGEVVDIETMPENLRYP